MGAVYTLPLCLPPEHQYLSEGRFYTSSALGFGGCCSGAAPYLPGSGGWGPCDPGRYGIATIRESVLVRPHPQGAAQRPD